MKKILLVAAIGIFSAGFAVAQDCTSQIDNNAVLPGLNPNPPAGSVEGVPYDEVNTLMIPRQVDNVLTGPPGDSIPLCKIQILDVIGMPAGYTYDVWGIDPATSNPYQCLMGAPGGAEDTIVLDQSNPHTRACIRLMHSNPPASSDMGDGLPDRDTALIQIAIGAFGDLGFGCTDLSSFGGVDTFEVRLPIHDAVYADIEDEETNNFAVYSNYPNPAQNFTYLRFNTPTAGSVDISIIDAVGRMINSATIPTNAGLNNYVVNTADLKSGVYIYNITYMGRTVSKKMVVNK